MFLAGTFMSDLHSNLQVNLIFHMEFRQALVTLEHSRQWFQGVKIIKIKNDNTSTTSPQPVCQLLFKELLKNDTGHKEC
jgi:hypothetical protein